MSGSWRTVARPAVRCRSRGTGSVGGSAGAARALGVTVGGATGFSRGGGLASGSIGVNRGDRGVVVIIGLQKLMV